MKAGLNCFYLFEGKEKVFVRKKIYLIKHKKENKKIIKKILRKSLRKSLKKIIKKVIKKIIKKDL